MPRSPSLPAAALNVRISLLLCLLAVPGCAVFRSPSNGLPPPPEQEVTYHLLSGDHILVKLIYTPELSEQVVVRPDGVISVPLVGEIQAAGRTPEALALDLQERFAKFLAKPDVSVVIRSFGGQRVYVGGEVVMPRMLPLDASTTVADAVFAAGGLRETACLDSVILLRRGKSPGEFQAFRVNLEEGLFGRAPLPELQPYDVVFVPKSRIAQVNQYVEMYVNRIIPHAVSFGATWIGGL
jgi:protein involved in polysaccharide export with SLBB domain